MPTTLAMKRIPKGMFYSHCQSFVIAFLIQYQSDLFGIKIRRPLVREITSLGCFYLTGLKTGLWKDINSLKEKTDIEKIFYPEKNNTKKIKNQPKNKFFCNFKNKNALKLIQPQGTQRGLRPQPN